ncbi:hypothetical protein OKW50_000696 [Paraburkholderia youngii]|uniref:hypothetical protein n=1 Tax=Paraburkholderia youngii TaxID=2782701 RepID=UPI003D1AFA3B
MILDDLGITRKQGGDRKSKAPEGSLIAQQGKPYLADLGTSPKQAAKWQDLATAKRGNPNLSNDSFDAVTVEEAAANAGGLLQTHHRGSSFRR